MKGIWWPMYKGYAEDLIKLGGAHYCFCSEEEIEAQRKEAESLGISFKFNDPCKHLSAEEVQAKLDAGEPYVIQLKVRAAKGTKGIYRDALT